MFHSNLDIFVIFKFAANVQSVVEQMYLEISGVIKEEGFEIVLSMQQKINMML
jgi:hypothetical protein